MEEGPLADPAALPACQRFRVGPPPALTGRALLTLILTGVSLATAVALTSAGGWARVIAGFTFLGALGLVYVPATLVIGSDGVTLRWLAWEMFVPHEAFEAQEESAEGLRLRATGGRLLDVRTSAARALLPLLRTRRLFAVSARGLLATEELSAHAGLLAAGDDRAAWIARLRTLQHGDYRAAATPRPHLLATLATPCLPIEQRAAAAIALGVPRDPEEADILSRARASTASPELGAVLRLAAEGASGAPVDRALAALLRARDREAGRAAPTP